MKLKSFEHLTLLQRYTIIFVIFIVIPIILLTWFTAVKLSSITEKQVGNTLLQLVQTSHISLDRTISEVDQSADKILITNEVQRMLKTPSTSEYERVVHFRELDELLSRYSSPKLRYSFFLKDSDKLYSFVPYWDVQTKGVFFTSNLEDLPWYQEASRANGKGIIRVIPKFGNVPPKSQTIAYIKQMNNVSSGGTSIGFLVIAGLEDLLQRYLDPLNLSKDGEIVMLNDEGIVITNSQAADVGKRLELSLEIAASSGGVLMSKEAGKKWLYAVHESDMSHTKLLYKVPIHSITGEYVTIRSLLNYLLAAYFMILIIVSGIFLRSILNPLTKLAHLTRMYEPGSTLPLKLKATKSNNELIVLNNLFLAMTERLNQTVHDKYVLELKQKEAELTILHSQINPHLLYNTLESIYWGMTIEGQSESAEMIRDLSLTMRIGLSRGKLLITIDEELTHVESYLRLQSKRYDYSYDVIWKIEEEARQYLIPKVVLQPLVENAIIHGIKRMGPEGKICTTIHTNGEYVWLHVEDNGFMNPDLERMNQILQGLEKERGYGIVNIDRRIKLHFGDNFGLSYSLGEYGGIKVTITIPTITIPITTANTN